MSAKKRVRGLKPHPFRNKLLLNQWLISLLGIDPLAEHRINGRVVCPFDLLAQPIRDPRLEGLGTDCLHTFYHRLVCLPRFSDGRPSAACSGRGVSGDMLLTYEQNLVRHTRSINQKRRRPMVWKYYQWLSLIFVEMVLDRFFGDPEGMLNDLNAYVTRFNRHHGEYQDVPPYSVADLNKLCVQNATGSGKTLLMHVNLLQYRHYAAMHGKAQVLSRVILLTPNARLSQQHIAEFGESDIRAGGYLPSRGGMSGPTRGLERVDVLEITKLADQDGPKTIATRSLGDQNLLLVDEGHRGMSGKEEGAWLTRRSQLCAKGFTFEYSATFEQAVQAGGWDVEDSYAKAVVFDYGYRWFYEDGFGKEYQILNLPRTYDQVQSAYLTACLLKYYQQLRIYEEKTGAFKAFHLEKPLWVFVGSSVTAGKQSRDEQRVAGDVALIILFIADFLDHRQAAMGRMQAILTGNGRDTGLVDEAGNDIFAGAFNYLAEAMRSGESIAALYQDILARLFQHGEGGRLMLARIKGESGEVALRVGNSQTPFGLINVGDAKALCDHVTQVAARHGAGLTVTDSDFTEGMFASVKDSSSPIHLLIGAKKFVEGWDCWRVSTMGLMHVGRSEGAQIIQLFGRGVRLKGYGWSLKRSGHAHAPHRPDFIEELETLNVFGIEADFMEKFRRFLQQEGLPDNERRKPPGMPDAVTDGAAKRPDILRPQQKAPDGGESPVGAKAKSGTLTLGMIPEDMRRSPVVADGYPRIAGLRSQGAVAEALKDTVALREQHLALLDFDALFFELEQFKHERGMTRLNITKAGIKRLLEDPEWYTLYLPEACLSPTAFAGVRFLQQVAATLLKRYCERLVTGC